MAGAVTAGAVLAVRSWRKSPSQAAQAISPTSSPLTAITSLPGAPYALLSIPDFARFQREFAATEMGALLHDPELRAKARAAADAFAHTPQVASLAVVAAALDDLAELGIESVTGGVFPLAGDAERSIGIAIALHGDDAQRILAWLDSQLAARSPRADGDVVCFDASLCRQLRGDVVFLGSSRAALDLADAILAAVERERVVSAVRRLEPSAGAVTGFVDIQALVKAAKTRLEADPEQARMLDRVGADAFDYLVYSQGTEGPLFRGSMILSYDEASAGLLGTLLQFPVRELTFDTKLPQHYDQAVFGHLDNPAATFERVLAGIRELMPVEAQQQIDQGLALASGLFGLDLKNDLFAALGGEIGVAYQVDTTAMPVSPVEVLESASGIVVVGVTDMPRLERLLARLEPLAAMQGMAITQESVAGGTIRTLPLPEANSRTPAIGLARDLLVIGTDRDEVRAVLAGTATTLSGDSVYRKRKEQFPDEESWRSYSRSLGINARNLLGSLLQSQRAARGHAHATQQSLSTIATAVEGHLSEHGIAPRAATISELATLLAPTPGEPLPQTDAWGEPIGYAASGKSYVLWSLGKDRTAERDWLSCLTGCDDEIRTTTGDDQDLVLARGQFIRWPEEAHEAPLATEATMPTAVSDLASALDARLAAWPPSMTVTRKIPGGIAYQALSPGDVSLSLLVGIASGTGPLASLH